jgi:hypothetical protein
MFGRVTASQIASASASVVLAAFDIALDVARRHQPNPMAERGQFTRPAHASMPIKHGASLAKNGSNSDRRNLLRTTIARPELTPRGPEKRASQYPARSW